MTGSTTMGAARHLSTLWPGAPWRVGRGATPYTPDDDGDDWGGYFDDDDQGDEIDDDDLDDLERRPRRWRQHPDEESETWTDPDDGTDDQAFTAHRITLWPCARQRTRKGGRPLKDCTGTASLDAALRPFATEILCGYSVPLTVGKWHRG